MPYYPMSESSERTEQEKIRDRQLFIDIIENREFQAYASSITKLMSSIFREGPILRDEFVSIIETLEREITKLEG